MIIDNIENIFLYEPILKHLRSGMEAVQALGSREPGRYEFDGGYFMVQKGTTKPMKEGTFEAHRKYVDVQIVLEGSEEIAWNHIDNLTSAIPYDSEKDAQRFNGDFEHSMMISEGMFYVAFPHDGHKAVSHTASPREYTKIVMKLENY